MPTAKKQPAKKKAPEIVLDPNNARVHDSQNKALIKKSLEELGTGRSVIMDKDGVMIAGNGVFEQAQELGIPVKVIRSTGKELVVIQRTDMAYEDPKRKQMAIADNAVSDSSSFREDLFEMEYFEEEDLTQWERTEDRPEYTPELNPHASLVDITPDQIDDAHKYLEGRFTENSQEKRDVVCPHCYREFQIAKYS